MHDNDIGQEMYRCFIEEEERVFQELEDAVDQLSEKLTNSLLVCSGLVAFWEKYVDSESRFLNLAKLALIVEKARVCLGNKKGGQGESDHEKLHT